ncbi:uncharacterized protein LOC114757108 [Neltuma alba]|uniref:uncharacterized protein LOC114757108 n=1 Tax=Neltuma alba TaxID=207710 RepID=UPI0010A401D1|nr:uncharacterized protein LOC114757108 [Prosopis alba]
MSLLNATQTNSVYSLAFTTKAQSCCLSGRTLTDSSFMPCFKSLQFQHFCVNLNAVYGNGFRVCASKKRGQARGVGIAEADDFDEDGGDSDYDLEDFSDEEDEDVDDDGVVMPFEQMRKWLKNKPRGFGVGKEYDTSIEDKLLDEIRKSREAQAANLNQLKNNPTMPGVKKDEEKKAQEVKSGAQVRLVSLPKKRNIHRDLKFAFQGIPGIVDIVPAVSGNKKTRDPVCKGFAFVYFKCEEDAARFVQLYSGQTVSFGKIQKRIKCELLNEMSPVSASLESSQDHTNAATPQLIVPAIEESSNEDSNMDNSASSSWDETASSSDELDAKSRTERVEENEDYAATLNADDADDGVELQIDSEIDSPSLEQKSPAKPKRANAAKKKPPSKEKVKKVPKLEVLGSAKRLKIKEKAVLSDVFSKYGSKAAFASKDG